MIIKTKRLELVMLNHKQLKALANDVSKLEEEMECYYQGEEIDDVYKNIIITQEAKLKEESNSNLHLWHTLWLIIKKEDRVIVGTIDFKGEPNAKGEAEIGYGLGKLHEHNGYMTEAVQAFCKWGREKMGIKYIIAETELDNIASQRVLQRCGFVEYDRDSTIWWKS